MGTHVSNWDKFSLLLWKNWTLQWSHKRQLIIELLLPVIFTLILVSLRNSVRPETKHATYFNPVNITTLKLFNDSIPEQRRNKQVTFDLYYSPENSLLAKIVEEAAINMLGMRGFKGFPNAQELENAVAADNVFAGVQFPNDWRNLSALPERFAYTLRFPSELRTVALSIGYTWITKRMFLIAKTVGPRNPNADDGGLPVGYLREGFLPIQNAISRAYIKQKSGVETLPNVIMQRYPYPKYIDDALVIVLEHLTPILLMISFIYPCTILTKQITLEKQKQLKEVMKIMGLQNWLHWTAWFFKAFTTLFISTIIICVLFQAHVFGDAAVFVNTSFVALFLYLTIYVISVICFSFMLSTFFSRANIAAAVTGLIFCITYIPYTFTITTYGDLSLATKLVYCLLSNTALGFGLRLIVQFETSGEGFHLGNMFTPISIDDSLTVGAVMGMMLLSSLIYLLICLYIEQIMPGEFGVPKKWNFPFSYQYWFGDSDYIGVEDIPNGRIERDPAAAAAFEADPEGKHAGVQVRNLRKRFGKRDAVKSLSINMYEDEITVLLGHNGAGKTTTVSMLTGMFPPTAGTATINGADIRTNIDGARASMGVCPQHNVLFDEMSVANHIVFFSRLKGVKGKDIDAEVAKYLKMIELEDKAQECAEKLSGGMKRKLSVCSALCGNTKVVLCDEPSSGMDPSARRQLWDLLQAEKAGRTILLTTHFMDEADVLGDRIAIMSEGELKCHGTSFFLKKKFGSGYNLICVKRENCNVATITALLNRYIPGLKPVSDIGAELVYQLPGSYSNIFEEMFAALEANSADLGLSGYGIGNTSLEEVFMKVGVEESAETLAKMSSISTLNGQNSSQADADADADADGDVDVECIDFERINSTSPHLVKGSTLLMNQWFAMLLKKLIYTYRNKLIMFVQLIVPMYYIISTVLSTRTYGVLQRQVPLTFSPLNYGKTVIVLDNATTSANPLQALIANQYKSIVESYGNDYQYAITGAATFTDYILRLGERLQVRIDSRYVAAATINDTDIIAWLNNEPLHTAPLTVNLVNNAIAKALIGTKAEISVTNFPLPYTTETVLNSMKLISGLGFSLASNICLAMCFVSSFYILFLIKERRSRAKLLQFVGGLRVWIYWLSHYLYDLLTFNITIIVALITLASLREEGFCKFSELSLLFILLTTFAFSALPFTYIISHMFKEPATGFAGSAVLNIFIGVALFMVVVTLDLIDPEMNTSSWIRVVCSFFPHFSLALSIHNLVQNMGARNACNKLPSVVACRILPACCNTTPYFAWKNPGVLNEIVHMLGSGVFWLIVLILWEYGIFNYAIHIIKTLIRGPPTPPEYESIDSDVQAERERVREICNDRTQLAHQNLVLDGVTKYYDKFLAVNQLSLCIKAKECFGLLGVNGAGKTTTFKMMTGDERITSGNAFVNGIQLDGSLRKINEQIGYCPQFDALLDDLTGRQWLRIFCLLRGIPSHRINHISEELAKSFGFMQHMDKPIQAYSGGNKRKLSTAIAIVGRPSIVYLDEPTTGMDPLARRQLWNMVCRIRDAGKSIVLTSHSMEECEALCTRMAIMVNGEFKCIGSTQHLKNKFSKGLILKLKVKRKQQLQEPQQPQTPASAQTMQFLQARSYLPKTSDYADNMRLAQQDIDAVKEFIDKELQQSILKEEYQGILTYYIPFSSVKWSTIFGLIERNRSALNIEDYTISQTTLEEIFLEFAKHQRDDPGDKNKRRRNHMPLLSSIG